MKTNVNMQRKMGNYEVIQRTKDGYFDANALLVQWNRNNNRRRMDDFLNSEKTKEFIEEIQSQEPEANNFHTDNQIVKKISGKKTKKGQTPDKVWMHPYLFIDFAMWINPKFKYNVIKFVYDQLIQYRHEAGDMYKGLTQAASKFPNVNYAQLAKGLNYIVFGRHETGIRQTATQEEMTKMRDLEKHLAFSIDMGMINSFDELIQKMRDVYLKKIDF